MSDTLQYTPLSNGSVTFCVIYFILEKRNIRKEGLIWAHNLRIQSIMVEEIMMAGTQKGT